jgi:signal transduction histidine kinase
VQEGNYYVRFFDPSGRMLAFLGSLPDGLPVPETNEGWQTVQDQKGIRYHQITLLLKTVRGESWSYMQIGRSLKEFDDHLATLKVLFAVGLPLSMLIVGGASWWLAGLAMRPVYKSYAQIQQFTADAAHELRTPIAAIRATVEAMHDADTVTKEAIQATLGAITRQNNRLAQLVQDLLLLARMDQKQLAENRQLCCLNDLVSDLVESLLVLELAASLKLTAQIQVKEPLVVLGDEQQLSRMLSNLVVNALQYTPAGGSVTVVLTREDAQAVVHVQDTGIGIAPENQPRLFDRFYRVQSDRSRQSGGAGLGLAIVKAIAQRHQGGIQLQSVLGQGSTFTVRLPLK